MQYGPVKKIFWGGGPCSSTRQYITFSIYNACSDQSYFLGPLIRCCMVFIILCYTASLLSTLSYCVQNLYNTVQRVIYTGQHFVVTATSAYSSLPLCMMNFLSKNSVGLFQTHNFCLPEITLYMVVESGHYTTCALFISHRTEVFEGWQP